MLKPWCPEAPPRPRDAVQGTVQYTPRVAQYSAVQATNHCGAGYTMQGYPEPTSTGAYYYCTNWQYGQGTPATTHHTNAAGMDGASQCKAFCDADSSCTHYSTASSVAVQSVGVSCLPQVQGPESDNMCNIAAFGPSHHREGAWAKSLVRGVLWACWRPFGGLLGASWGPLEVSWDF